MASANHFNGAAREREFERLAHHYCDSLHTASHEARLEGRRRGREFSGRVDTEPLRAAVRDWVDGVFAYAEKEAKYRLSMAKADKKSVPLGNPYSEWREKEAIEHATKLRPAVGNCGTPAQNFAHSMNVRVTECWGEALPDLRAEYAERRAMFDAELALLESPGSGPAEQQRAATGRSAVDEAASGTGTVREVAASKLPRLPQQNAWQAWRLRTMMGVSKQQEIAEKLQEFGVAATQGQVSRWLKQVDDFLNAGGTAPPFPTQMQKPQNIDPRIIELGERHDGRTPRQRGRRDADSDNAE